MKHLPFIAFAATVTATAVAASQIILPNPPVTTEVIEIEVAPQDLARCWDTLAQVASMPAVSDAGTPLPVSAAQDLPRVACVATDA